MIDIGSRTGHKIGILLILTTLTIGSAAAISWNSPSADSEHKDNGLTLEVSNNNSAENITFQYKGPNDSSYSVHETKTSVSGSSTVSPDNDFTAGSGNYGAYSFKVNTSKDNSATISNVVLDGAVPSIGSFSPSDGEYTNNGDDLDVSYSASDDHTAVDFQNISISSESESENNSDLTGLSLDDGSYTVDYWVNDTVGNVKSGSWEFTVDTSYDGDDNPSFSVEDASDGVVVFDEDKDLTVDFGDADSTSDTTVTCYVGGEDIGSFTVTSDNPDESDTTCNIDQDDDEDYYDDSAEVYLKMEDEAGNTAESDKETFSFDVNPPLVTGLSIPANADLYNSNFDVAFSADDSASGVETVEYYFSSGTSEGDGTDFGYSSDRDNYEVNTSGLSAGDHAVYVRAKDKADRWSTVKSVDFSFDPNAVPEISLSIPESVSVTAGDEGSFDVTVENTGKIYVSSLKVSASSGSIFSDSQTVSDLAPGSSKTVKLDLGTKEENIGKHVIDVKTDNPSKTKKVDLIVEANSDQQSQIDSDLSDHHSRLQRLESNVTELKSKVSDSKRQRLESNFSDFKQKVEDAQKAVESGEYYKAESILENIDQDYSAAESSYAKVRKEYKNNRFWMLVFAGFGGIVVLGGAVVGGLSYTDEVDFDVRDYLEKLQELELDTSSLADFTDKIQRKMEGKDTSDAEDFEWDGFNN